MVFPAVSHIITAVELTVVELTQAQEVTQDELDLWTKFGAAQAEQTKAAGEPRLVVWMPNGRAQVALHWFMELFTR